jgi:hypothetical protein
VSPPPTGLRLLSSDGSSEGTRDLAPQGGSELTPGGRPGVLFWRAVLSPPPRRYDLWHLDAVSGVTTLVASAPRPTSAPLVVGAVAL